MRAEDILRSLPLVAILRGVRPDEVVAIGHALYGGGIRCMEVPLNSPDPLASIEAQADRIEAGIRLAQAAVRHMLDTERDGEVFFHGSAINVR